MWARSLSQCWVILQAHVGKVMIHLCRVMSKSKNKNKWIPKTLFTVNTTLNLASPFFFLKSWCKKRKKKEKSNSGFIWNFQRHLRFLNRKKAPHCTHNLLTLYLHDHHLYQILQPEGLSRWLTRTRYFCAPVKAGSTSPLCHIYTVGLLQQFHTSLWSHRLFSMAERSWSVVVSICIPGRRTASPLWGHTASPWPPRPGSPHPPPGLGLQRRHGRTVWRGGTQGAGTARRSRSSGRTSGHSEQSRLEGRISVWGRERSVKIPNTGW